MEDRGEEGRGSTVLPGAGWPYRQRVVCRRPGQKPVGREGDGDVGRLVPPSAPNLSCTVQVAHCIQIGRFFHPVQLETRRQGHGGEADRLSPLLQLLRLPPAASSTTDGMAGGRAGQQRAVAAMSRQAATTSRPETSDRQVEGATSDPHLRGDARVDLSVVAWLMLPARGVSCGWPAGRSRRRLPTQRRRRRLFRTSPLGRRNGTCRRRQTPRTRPPELAALLSHPRDGRHGSRSAGREPLD
jgi:hypothetical protein